MYRIFLAFILPWHLVIEPVLLVASVVETTNKLKSCLKLRPSIAGTARPKRRDDGLAQVFYADSHAPDWPGG
ncbi:MAG TPA: hypothetical protein VG797_06725 [Phycisphaerales bacterium]|nr:hypothetical protein [Phycisphaerales bacterium]